MFRKKLLQKIPTPRFLKFSYVGLECSPEGVRYAEVLNGENGYHLGRYGFKKTSYCDSVFENDEIKQILKSLVKEEKIEYIKSTLPEEKTYLFTINVEGETEKSIRNYIEFRLEENVPIPVSEALFEFYILPKKESDTKKRAVVSVVAKDTVEEYINFFESVGMTPVSFMVESTSISRTVLSSTDKETRMVVCFSENKTLIFIVSGGFVQFSSTINFGVGIITSALAKYYNIEKSEAIAMKEKGGVSFEGSDDEKFSIIANAVSILRDEIQKVSIYWKTHRVSGGEDEVKNIILCGKDSSLDGLSEYLAKSLKQDVVLANVWENFPIYKKHIPEIEFKESLLYPAILGLSLQV